MKNLRVNVCDEKDARKYILKAERDFAKKLDDAIEGVFKNGIPRIIALSGPTCSGKTTTANKLEAKIDSMGMEAVTLSIDDFFLDRTDRNFTDGEAPDYDSVAAIDLEYLEEFVRDLLQGKTVRVPHFDFPTTHRDYYTDFTPSENDIYVFEGIQAVYPEITSLFGDSYVSIFIRVADDVRYRGQVLEKNDIRLFRRLVRDYKFRGANADFTLHLWNGVRDNEEKNIFPNAGDCDIYIDSFLRYEPFIMADKAVKILDTVPADSRYRKEADELAKKLRIFENECFKDEMIPDNSMFREFIG